jgi:hypothetical protein
VASVRRSRDARLTTVLAGLSTWLTPGLVSVGLVFGAPLNRGHLRARNEVLRSIEGRRL